MKARVIFCILSFTLLATAQINRLILNIAVIEMEEATFGDGWDGKVLTLGAFYWCSWITILLGASLARRFGFRNVLTGSVLIGGAANFIFPISYRFHPICAALVRAVQGFAMGPTWPVVTLMAAAWIPRNERSKFASTFHGTAVGTLITYIFGGFLINYTGWPSIFYASGSLSIIWVIFWWYLASDTPDEHPRISEEELKYLQEAIGEHKLQKTNYKTPWKEMLMSKAFWGNILGQTGSLWSHLATAIEFPQYLHNVHAVEIKMNGLIVGLPHIFGFIVSIGFAIFLDRMIKTEVLSVSGARKLATIISHLFSSIFMLILAYFGSSNIYVAAAMIVISSVLIGVAPIGCLANCMDISPNNSGTIMSIGRMVAVLTGFVCPIIIKHYTAEDPLNFIPILNITSIINIISGVGFCILSSGEVQHWDKPRNNENVEENNELMHEKTRKDVNT